MTIEVPLTRNSKKHHVYNSVSEQEFEPLNVISKRVSEDILRNGSLSATLLALNKSNLIDRKNVNGAWWYKKNKDYVPYFFSTKQTSPEQNIEEKTRRKTPWGDKNEAVNNFLKNNIGNEFTAKQFAEACDYNMGLSNHYKKLSDLEQDGVIAIVDNKRPIKYKVLQTGNLPIKSPLKIQNESAEQIEMQTLESATLLKELTAVPELNLSGTIENIVKIDQQNKLYRKALHQIASILVEIDFLDTH